ncbi:uncharacterized protein [Palaemon carinicauda]|uniref:uncharacterized protein n=1 Tax=Palaemon carinicauda TaxID=392227 RepID=UPI0035B5F7A6
MPEAAISRSLLLLATAVLLPGIDASKALSCEEECHCVEQKGLTKEMRIVCNNTGSEPVHLAKEILSFPSSVRLYEVYVRVENSPHVTITEGFLTAWKAFHSSALDVWDVAYLSFPKNLPEKEFSDPLRQVFAGIGIKGCTLDELPRYLFSGKQKAGLRLLQSTVGIIQTDAFSHVETLRYLEVVNATIGIFKQPAAASGKYLSAGTSSSSGVQFHNSVIGRIESGAFNVSSANQEMLFDNVTVGRLDTDAIVISQTRLILRNSSVGDMRSGALRTEDNGNIRVKNNYIIAQPGALTHLKCSYSDHHITDNHIVVAYSGAMEPVEPDWDEATNATETIFSSYQEPTLVDMASSSLKQVLDPTCIPLNLPNWAIETPCRQVGISKPSISRENSRVMYIVLYSLIGICIIAIIACIALACILVNAKNRRPTTVNSPAIVMSQINDPLYEEAAHFLIPSQSVPPVPPPVQSLPPGKEASCSGTFSRNGCAAGALSNARVENEYAAMR